MKTLSANTGLPTGFLAGGVGDEGKLPADRAHRHGHGKSRAQSGRTDSAGSLPAPRLPPSPPDPWAGWWATGAACKAARAANSPRRGRCVSPRGSAPHGQACRPHTRAPASLRGRAGSGSPFPSALLSVSLHGTATGQRAEEAGELAAASTTPDAGKSLSRRVTHRPSLHPGLLSPGCPLLTVSGLSVSLRMARSTRLGIPTHWLCRYMRKISRAQSSSSLRLVQPSI